MKTKFLQNFILLFSIFLFLSSDFLKAQGDSAPGPTIQSKVPVNSVITDPPIYIPPDASKTSTANTVRTYGPGFDVTLMPAVEFACGIIEGYISSGVGIKVLFNSQNLGENGSYAETEVPIVRANMHLEPDFPAENPSYQLNTWYVAAAANNMWGVDKYTQGANVYAIEININTHYMSSFYLPTDGGVGPNQVDLATLIIHEMIHGLGMIVGLTESGGFYTWKWGTQEYPLAYSRYIKNVTTGDFIPNMTEFSQSFNDFLQSDDLIFEGILYSNANPKIYAPNPYEEGSSIQHFDELSFLPTPPAAIPEESLMTPIVNKGVAIHQVGPITTNLLKELGWDDLFGTVTGIEDYFEIMGVNCASSPATKLTPTNTYKMTSCYEDYEPSNTPPSNYSWNLEVFYRDESNNFNSYTLVTGDVSDMNIDYTYDMYVPDLFPWGNDNIWLRNMDGTVKAKLSLSAWGGFYAEKEMKIVYPPSIPETEITIHNCQGITLDFYSMGASSYIIHYSTTPGEPYENVVNIEEGNHSYTFSGLSKFNDYYFRVEAINSDGQSTWGPQITKNSCCSIEVDVFPNPTMIELQIRTELEEDDLLTPDDYINIEEVNVYKVTDPSLNVNVEGGEVQEVNVPVHNLPTGTYIIETKSSQCGTKTTQIIKQ